MKKSLTLDPWITEKNACCPLCKLWLTSENGSETNTADQLPYDATNSRLALLFPEISQSRTSLHPARYASPTSPMSETLLMDRLDSSSTTARTQDCSTPVSMEYYDSVDNVNLNSNLMPLQLTETLQSPLSEHPADKSSEIGTCDKIESVDRKESNEAALEETKQF